MIGRRLRRAGDARGDADDLGRPASTSISPARRPPRSSASTCRCPTPRPTRCSGSAAWSPRRSRTMPARSSPLTVSAPAGAILNAPKPAPVASRHVIGQMLPDVVFGCLRQIIPERVPAEGTSCLWNLNVRGQTRSGAGGNYGFSMAVTSQRRHRRALRQGRPVGHRLSQRRARHAGRDRRDADAADLLAQGAAPGFAAAPAAPAAASARSSRSAAASTRRSTFWRPSTASIIRRAAATAARTARPAMSG